ncbi:hypothetical protein PoB_004655000 [Plakobranchus ocellatus]|uniref:Uncharacterized protein n=1 Tax=Plakobranchus ocellatus TaxID=259542 RepID=A0AAV4BKN5_9GAST|nr:hypothetical protein PoB_004655000 [Plakobranchus ocellatus]
MKAERRGRDKEEGEERQKGKFSSRGDRKRFPVEHRSSPKTFNAVLSFCQSAPIEHRPLPKTFHAALSLCLSAPSGAQAITKDFPCRPVSLSFSSQWSTGHYQRLSMLPCLFVFQLPVEHRPSPKTFHAALSLCLLAPSGAQAITKDLNVDYALHASVAERLTVL